MRTKILCAFLGMCFIWQASAKDPLIFAVNHPGSKPYLYFNQGKQAYQGVIPDILKPLQEKNIIVVRYTHYSRKGSEQSLYQGKSDMMMLSQKWLKSPNKVIATVAIDEHKSFLYGVKKFADNFSLKHSLNGQKLCTRLGFTYPNLEPYLQSQQLVRMDSSSHLSMLRLLLDRKCDFVVLNEFNAYNLASSSFLKDTALFSSPIPVSIVPLNIILRAELSEEKTILDQHINKLRASGEMHKLLLKHAKKRPG